VRRSWLALCVVGIAGGIATEAWAYELDQPLLWLPDLGVGVALIIAGSASAPRARGAAWLLVAAGFAWYAGTLAPEATYWHRGLLVHLIVSFPGARPASRSGWLVIMAGYAVAVAGPVWRDESASIILAALALVLCVAGLRRAFLRRQRSRQIACGVGAGLAAVLIAGAIARLVVSAGAAALPSLLAYEAALVIAASYLWVGLRPVATATVTDLVIELGENRSTTLRDALADVLGDPKLRLGYWQASSASYVDDRRGSLTLSAAGADQVMTRIERDGQPFAALVHDSAFATDSTFAKAFSAADRLTSVHAALNADIQARAADVSASRHRLQVASDEERRRLERRLAAAPESRLIEMSDELGRLSRQGNAHLNRAAEQLRQTLVELRELAHGLYPRDLAGGLSMGLEALARRCTVPVELSVTRERVDSQIEVAAYYLCAEALANVAKHAQASTVSVDVAVRSGVFTVRVADNGVGGATPTGGTGLLGLIDRVESIGGHLLVESEPGVGTKLTAEIPLDGQPR